MFKVHTIRSMYWKNDVQVQTFDKPFKREDAFHMCTLMRSYDALRKGTIGNDIRDFSRLNLDEFEAIMAKRI